jgi:quercetin dioxygenase-like cupin family protein
MTIQCLEGRLDLCVGGLAQRIEAGQLLFLAAHVPHSLTALEDACALITIVVRKP